MRKASPSNGAQPVGNQWCPLSIHTLGYQFSIITDKGVWQEQALIESALIESISLSNYIESGVH